MLFTCPSLRIKSQIFSFAFALISIPSPQGAKVINRETIILRVASSIVEHSSRKNPEINLIIKGMAPMPTMVDTEVIKIDKFISPRRIRAKNWDK